MPLLLIGAYPQLGCNHNRPLWGVARSVVTEACDIGGIVDAVELAPATPGVGVPSQTLGDVTGPVGARERQWLTA